VSNSLGFSGANADSCCKSGSIAYPLHTVTISVRLNSVTTVKIQQGRPLTAGQTTCDAVYSWGQSYDSWGRTFRTVTWTRDVPDDAYIRLRFCKTDEADACTDDVGIPNQLLKFEIDNASALQMLHAVAVDTAGTDGVVGCIKVGCFDTDADCGCVTPVVLSNIKAGTEIIAAPIGSVLTTVLPLA
jgi:hypothetical protein